ncbi:hypothetical protein DDZ13_01020 [Coraliomargarita sinensis]|uniref:Uncharacterized protein n=1 Tax=Coraliomargarita sinensis TaxID=2174842 RepID=A0A317ZPZ3_9BACT|nr:hypothetical protein [Coraliomargarita sinensis]PXA05481.1 hypothetical protein DDZ13_01020 [Coraliomargarita sinensis]
MRSLIYTCLACLLLSQVSLSAKQKEAATDPAWDGLAFSIEDSRCFVGLAPVYLSVSKLKPKDGNLVGTYTINVPLMTSKNDKGKIVLPLKSKVSVLGAKGGVLKGKAHSETEEGAINDIVCVIRPEKDQAIELAITTEHRTVNFKSRYTVIEAKQDG